MPTVSSTPASTEYSNERFRFGLRSIFVVFALVAAAILLIRSIVDWSEHRRVVREQAAIREACKSAFKIVAITIRLNDERRQLAWPPEVPLDANGKPLNSWRFQLYRTFAVPDVDFPYPHDPMAPWNAPANKQQVGDDQMPFCFANRPRSTTTYIFGIAGSDTAFDAKAVDRLSALPSTTVVMMEVADSKTHWMQPGDYDVAELLAATGRLGDTVKGVLPDRVHVLFADGEVWALSPDMPIDALKPFLKISTAKAADREKLLSGYRADE